MQRTAATPPANRGANCKISCYNGNSGFADDAAAANAHVGRYPQGEVFPMDYIKLIQQGESETVEFKKEFPSSASDIAKEVAAFANNKGGLLFIGVGDQGNIVGIEQPDKVIQRIVGVVRQCDPPLQPQIKIEYFESKSIVVVQVSKHNVPVAVDGKFYIRVGTSAVAATSRDLTKLLVRNLLDQINVLDILDEPFAGFSPENLAIASSSSNEGSGHREEDAEAERVKLYENFQGVFLVHRWRPSTLPGQKADIVISLVQHNQGPLTARQVASVDYFLGPKFPGSSYHKDNYEDDFALRVSAYAPMLCLAKVNLLSGEVITLYRYCDFPADL
ncbi:MAG: ATP-binding protein [Gammaproteobacteria bacterium]|nr:MAG: ATP-binding protein [Gammaproteobacteria bacterium]